MRQVTARDLLLSLLLLSTLPLGYRALAPAPPLGPPAAGPAAPAVDLNHAPIEELLALDGVGPKLAEAIAASRPFATVDDLTRVPGIGPKRLASLRPYVKAE